MAVVVLDTSALMLPVELDVHLFDELERLLGEIDAVVPTAVVNELERLAEVGGRAGRAAGVGQSLAASSCRTIDTDATGADDAVLALAMDGPAAYVVTADRELARRANDHGVAAITPRGRRRLAIEPA